jgi:arsenate reductase (glutaredoxin)
MRDGMEIWFNPDCSKCRIAVKAVEESGQAFTLRTYLEVPPTEAEHDDVLTKLGKEPWEICRMKEPIAQELGLASLEKDRAKWIALMVKHPILIERPILVRSDGKAVVGRSEDALGSVLQR